MKNPWGDPLLVHYPISRIAVWAFAISVLALVCATLPVVSPTDDYRRPVYGPEVAALLALLQVIGTPAGLALAYVALLSCRINGSRPGRGLAWAALAISYALTLWLLAILAVMLPILSWAYFVVVIVAVLHIPAFAAESSFAKHAVAFVLIGGTFFSLVSCALLHSRERSRVLQCHKNLWEIGTNLTLASESQVEQQQPSPANDDELRRLLQQVLDQAKESDTNRKWAPAE